MVCGSRSVDGVQCMLLSACSDQNLPCAAHLWLQVGNSKYGMQGSGVEASQHGLFDTGAQGEASQHGLFGTGAEVAGAIVLS